MNLSQAKELLWPAYDCLSDDQVKALVKVMEAMVEYLVSTEYAHKDVLNNLPSNIES